MERKRENERTVEMVEGERARQIGETRRGERKERFCSRTYSTGAQTIWNENKIKSRFDHCQSILGFFRGLFQLVHGQRLLLAWEAVFWQR